MEEEKTNEETNNEVPMDEIIDPLSAALSSVDKPAEEPVQEVPVKKKSNLPALIVLVVCVVGIILVLTKPWDKSDEPEETPQVTDLTTQQEPEKSVYDSAVEGDIISTGEGTN